MIAETIFAPLTGAGRAAVTVMRLSGPDCARILRSMAGILPAPRHATLVNLRTQTGALLDRGMVLWFPAPASFTGEDCVELHLHGGRAVLNAASLALVAYGARPAEPGEFSRRAFFNGKLDLLQAEGIADLIDAESEAQRRQALDHVAGALSARCAQWRLELRRLMAIQEALIDFSDEDVPESAGDEIGVGIDRLRAEIDRAIADGAKAELVREGLSFAVLGAPNAGKSTLVNALAGSDIAIVSAMPGTTRDIVECRIILAGVPVRLSDTAGLRETDEPIEAEGIARARKRGREADLVIYVAAAPHCAWPAAETGGKILKLATKSDLGEVQGADLAVSALTNEGMDLLRERLGEIAAELTDHAGSATAARPRQLACLRDVAAALGQARGARAAELRAEDLRMAANALARMVGSIGVEEVLGEIFSSFCIGK
jgi:tRNA modification GTPase